MSACGAFIYRGTEPHITCTLPTGHAGSHVCEAMAPGWTRQSLATGPQLSHPSAYAFQWRAGELAAFDLTRQVRTHAADVVAGKVHVPPYEAAEIETVAALLAMPLDGVPRGVTEVEGSLRMPLQGGGTICLACAEIACGRAPSRPHVCSG